MDMFVIRGGASLAGQVAVSGSKNASLPIMAASLACRGVSKLRGVPNLVDVRTMGQLLGSLGCRVERTSAGTVEIEAVDPSSHVADYDLVRRMRASVCVLGPLLASRGQACVSLPGGCNIGHRPIDLHLKGLSALGAEFRIERGYVVGRARRLRGARISLSSPQGSTVTGTCNVLVAAALAKGTTVIESAACEPEVVDLGQFLNRAGASISGLGTPVITVEGVEHLEAGTHDVIPDRIEAATLIMAALITRSQLTLDNVPVDHLGSVLDKLRETGAEFLTDSAAPYPPLPETTQGRNRTLTIDGTAAFRSVECTATPHPGFPTDLQAQLTSLLTLAEGTSVVSDRVFPDRFMHASELLRMGAQLRRSQNSVFITGVPQLTGASVMASDLRASAALVLAALAARGESVIRRIYHLDRGYEGLEQKLTALGAEVLRVKDEPHNIPASLQVRDAA